MYNFSIIMAGTDPNSKKTQDSLGYCVVDLERNSSYFVSDYVYFETSSTTPYQIRRIEELNKVSYLNDVDVHAVKGLGQASV